MSDSITRIFGRGGEEGVEVGDGVGDGDSEGDSVPAESFGVPGTFLAIFICEFVDKIEEVDALGGSVDEGLVRKESLGL